MTDRCGRRTLDAASASAEYHSLPIENRASLRCGSRDRLRLPKTQAHEAIDILPNRAPRGQVTTRGHYAE
jgi:hypothetical protein